MRSSTIAGCCAVAAMLVSGCGGSDGGGKPPFRTPDLGDVAVVTADVQLPFDRYELSSADRVRIQAGHARLIEDCLHDRGFDVRMFGDYLRPPGIVPWGGPVGTMTRDHASRLGYQAGPEDPFKLGAGIYTRTLDNITLDPQMDPTLRSDPQFQSALHGAVEDEAPLPEGVELPTLSPGVEPFEQGCFEVVDKQLDAPLPDTLGLSGDVIDLAVVHPDVAERMEAWTACMEVRGHQYKTVVDPIRQYNFEEVSAAQTRT
ncbi:hypothetical protein, partial [Nocardioides sp. GCM10030258]